MMQYFICILFEIRNNQKREQEKKTTILKEFTKRKYPFCPFDITVNLKRENISNMQMVTFFFSLSLSRFAKNFPHNIILFRSLQSDKIYGIVVLKNILLSNFDFLFSQTWHEIYFYFVFFLFFFIYFLTMKKKQQTKCHRFWCFRNIFSIFFFVCLFVWCVSK